MHAAIGHRTRYEILYRLVHSSEMGPKELEAAMSIEDSTLHYHLNDFVDVGLVEKRRRTERSENGYTLTTGQPFSARLPSVTVLTNSSAANTRSR